MSTKTTADIIDSMGIWFDKFPVLPKNWRETLVKITPIFALIFGILGIFVSVAGLGVFTATSPLAFLGGATAVSSYGTGFISMIIYLIGYLLLLAAYPGTKAKKYKGWKLLFWSQAANLIGGVISLSILYSIISALIGFYLLFQIRSYYK
ncbi:MAG TPA: hypothetical protein VNW29_02350 [Candidatus Sulfotelmatobacter sp.]|jgi:hypothetical protein|nr:hypothetical protein [Candidatus Sulfotelmatobacter sp.]